MGRRCKCCKSNNTNCGISYLCSKLCLSHIYEITEKLPLLVLHMHTLNCTTFLYTKLSLHMQTHYTNKGQQQLMHKEKRTQEESRAVLDKTAMLPDCCSKRKEAVMSTKNKTLTPPCNVENTQAMKDEHLTRSLTEQQVAVLKLAQGQKSSKQTQV